MLNMENTKTLHALDEFAKAKPNEIPRELDEYLSFVANTGDPVYQWSLVKILFRQKLLNVIMEFYESCPMLDVPLSPNLDAFNFEIMKKRLLERYDTFSGVPFTIQRIADLLTAPKQQYTRLDKYMRALEKNIWVVSTRETIGREILADQTNMVNGALPNVVHSNNINPSPERFKRQPGSFDNEEDEGVDLEDQDPDPNHSASGDQYTFEPEGGQMSEITSEAEHIEVSISTDQTDSVPSPREPEENAQVLEPSSTEPESCSSSEVLGETVSEQPTSTEEAASSADDIVSVVEPEPDGIVDEKDTVEEISEEKEKTEDITVTEITEESNSSAPSEEITGTPMVDEPPSNAGSESGEDNKQEKVDLKRKIEEVIGEEEEVPNKKIEIQPPVEIEACEPVEEFVPEDFVQVAQVSSSDAVVVVEETMEKEAEQVESIAEAVQVEESLEQLEGEMESTPIEEKAEEPDLSMDVDETSVQSPMVQEDAGEPMEEVELGAV